MNVSTIGVKACNAAIYLINFVFLNWKNLSVLVPCNVRASDSAVSNPSTPQPSVFFLRKLIIWATL